MSENKVQFNLKNVHVAKMTDEGYDAPFHVPGAVSLALDPQGDVVKFYADGIIYFSAENNMGYSGDLEMARFPDRMLQEIWNFVLGSTSKVLTENANALNSTFALLFQIDGDQENELYALYACSGTRPNVGGKTNGESIEPQTQKSSINAVPLANGAVMARTTSETPKDVRDNWFRSVFVEESA